MFRSVNSKETGTMPVTQSRILKPLWRLTCKSSPVLLNDKAIKYYNTRVFLPYMAAPSGHKFGFTQSYGRTYGGIVLDCIEFTGSDFRHVQVQYVFICSVVQCTDAISIGTTIMYVTANDKLKKN